MYFGLYDGVVCIDHRGDTDKVYVASLGIVDSEEKRVDSLKEKITKAEAEGIVIPSKPDTKVLM